MLDFSLSRSLALMGRTAPYLLFRLAVYFGIALAYVLATGAGASVGYGVGMFGEAETRYSTAFWGGAAGFGLTAGLLYLAREYLLYMVKAGHIAVMVELLDGRPLPEGRGQVAYGAAMVRERFVSASVLFGIDQLVKGVIAAVTGLLDGIAGLLPIPGLRSLVGLVRAFLNVAVGFVDEVILAHALRTRAENPWDAAGDALVLYGQNHRAMIKNAAAVAVIVYGLSFLVFLVMLAPAAFVAYLIPGSWSAGGIVFALLFAWAVKAAVIEPFAIASMLQAYVNVTDGQAPDPSWRRKLDGLSSRFGALGERARDWVTGTGATRRAPEPGR